MRLARPLLTAAIAALASVAFAGPALADTTVPLNQTKDNKTVLAKTFTPQLCNDERFAPRAAGEDGWHFVLPEGDGNFIKLTLTFKDLGGNTVVVVIPDPDDSPYKNDMYGAGSSEKHAYLFTPAGWTLTAGSAEISGGATFFNLSHACGGTPASPSASPSTKPSTSTTPSAGTTPSSGTSGSPGVTPSPSEPSLPVTGTALTGIITAGVLLVAAGVGTLFFVRRRRDLPTEV